MLFCDVLKKNDEENKIWYGAALIYHGNCVCVYRNHSLVMNI